MIEVQVFDGAGPDPVHPVDEQGRPHGVWKLTKVNVGYKRDEFGFHKTDLVATTEVVYEHGVVVG